MCRNASIRRKDALLLGCDLTGFFDRFIVPALSMVYPSGNDVLILLNCIDRNRRTLAHGDASLLRESLGAVQQTAAVILGGIAQGIAPEPAALAAAA